MGGCYSTDSEGAMTSPKHKLPAEKQAWCNEKGPQYSSLTNGDSQFKEDELLKQSKLIISVSPVSAPPLVDSQALLEEAGKAKGVVPSDSGIESIGPPAEESSYEAAEKNQGISLCRSCHTKLKRISRGSCEQCGQFRLDTSELSSLLNGQAYCTCSPREAGKQSGCRTHGIASPVSPSCKRHSDIPVRLLKSNLKKQGQGRGDQSKHVRMSWKSADSLDLCSAMNTCMDRAKSEASDVFGDDISFRAPLAQFDSVDNQLNVENMDEEGDDVFFTSRMSIYSEILELTDSICHCDFSDTPLEGSCISGLCESEDQSSPCSKTKQPFSSQSTPTRFATYSEHPCSGSRLEEDEDRENGLSKSSGHLGSSSKCNRENTGEKADRGVTLRSSPLGRAAVNALESLSAECEEVLCPVSLVVRGRQMIMMDARLYSQLLTDLCLLKQQLLRLSQILQAEGDDAVV
ncbi:hypothetical protein ACOMHN_000457 [Nucella lapillus]